MSARQAAVYSMLFFGTFFTVTGGAMMFGLPFAVAGGFGFFAALVSLVIVGVK